MHYLVFVPTRKPLLYPQAKLSFFISLSCWIETTTSVWSYYIICLSNIVSLFSEPNTLSFSLYLSAVCLDINQPIRPHINLLIIEETMKDCGVWLATLETPLSAHPITSLFWFSILWSRENWFACDWSHIPITPPPLSRFEGEKNATTNHQRVSWRSWERLEIILSSKWYPTI